MIGEFLSEVSVGAAVIQNGTMIQITQLPFGESYFLKCTPRLSSSHAYACLCSVTGLLKKNISPFPQQMLCIVLNILYMDRSNKSKSIWLKLSKLNHQGKHSASPRYIQRKVTMSYSKQRCQCTRVAVVIIDRCYLCLL